MDSLANYGSDDDYEEAIGDKTGTLTTTRGSSRTVRSQEADANYDEVQMDLSEESNNNNSNEDDDRRRDSTPEHHRSHRSRSRSPDNSNSRHKRHHSPEREHKTRDEERPRKYESKSKYDSRETSSTLDERMRKSPKYRESKSKYRDEKMRKRKRSNSRERKRSMSRERKQSPSRERKCSPSRERKQSPSRERKQSPSRERKQSPSRERKQSPSRERKQSPSREPKRSLSREQRYSPARVKKHSSSHERRRSRSPRRMEFKSRPEEDRSGNRYTTKRFDRTSNKMAQLEKLGIEIKTPDAEFVTPQMLLQRSMDEQVQKVKHSTGIDLPNYYNPGAVNPTRYADQIQKRRLLWQKKAPEQETKTGTSMEKVWQQTTFAQDSDGKVASKFKRLMGIKEPESGVCKPGGKDILKKQEEMFSSMEQQYEVARTATHTMRGVGLGFGTFQYPR